MATRLALLIALLVALFVPSGAGAAGWVPIGTLPANNGFISAGPGADASGTTWAITATDGSGQSHVYARPPGGSFALFATLDGVDAYEFAVGDDGTVVAVADGEGSSPCTVFVRRPGGAAFTGPSLVGSKCGDDDRAVVTPSGEVLVAYSEHSSGSVMHVAQMHADGGYGDQTPNGQDPGAEVGDLEVGHDGRAIALINDAPDSTHIRLSTSDENAAGTFGALATVRSRPLGGDETTQTFYREGVREDARGDRLVFWVVTAYLAPGYRASITARGRVAGQSAYGALQVLDSSEYSIISPTAALDADGDATVAWVRDADSALDSPRSVVGSRATAAGGYAFPDAGTTVVPSQAYSASLAALAGGGITGALDQSDSGAILPLVEPAGSPLVAGPAFDNGSSGGGLDVRPDAHGNAYVGLSRSDHNSAVDAYDGTAPAPGAISAPSSTVVGSPAALSLAATDSLSGVASVTWDFGDGQTASGASVSHVWSAPGQYVVNATATDGAGNSAVAAPVTVTVTAPALAPPLIKDTTAPVISKASLSHASFAVSSSSTATTAKKTHKAPPKGTQIAFTLSEAATVTLTFTRHTAGEKSGKSCKATTKHVAKSKRCSATVTDGTLSRSEKAGAATVSFSGRIGHAALKHGAHSLAIVAKDPAGNVSRPTTLPLTIVRG